MKKWIFLFTTLLFSCFSIYAENKDFNQTNTLMHETASSKVSQNTREASLTAHYLNLSANCRIGALSSIAVAGVFSGIISTKGDSFNTDNQKNKVLGIGLGVCGVSALAFLVADVIFYKKAAKAAKLEIRLAHEGIGMNIAF